MRRNENTSRAPYRRRSGGLSFLIAPGVSRISLSEYRAALAAASSPEGSRARPKPARGAREEDLQIECNDWLEVRALKDPEPLSRMFHPPNGGRRGRAEAGRFKAMGVKKGVPDWICPIPHRGWSGLAIEMKGPDGRLSKDQGEWLEALKAAGYLTGVARSLGDFITLVERYVAGRTRSA